MSSREQFYVKSSQGSQLSKGVDSEGRHEDEKMDGKAKYKEGALLS